MNEQQSDPLDFFEGKAALKRTRESLGLSQEKLSKLSKQPKWLIANLEVGRRKMKGPEVDAIWDALAAYRKLQQKERGSRFTLKDLAGNATWTDVAEAAQAAAKSFVSEAIPEAIRELSPEEHQRDVTQYARDLREMYRDGVAAGKESAQELLAEKDKRIAQLENLLNDYRAFFHFGEKEAAAHEKHEELAEHRRAARRPCACGRPSRRNQKRHERSANGRAPR
jgi:transcriptional regulator with XRE-family HTH domain